MKRLMIFATFVVAALGLLASFAGAAGPNTVGPITFEPSQGYVIGTIDGQQGWMKTGAYDVAVANVATFPDAAGYGFGTQALRLSDAVTSGGFGDQTFSPGLASPAGESPLNTHFEATFKIGTTQASTQSGLHMSVSPDNGSGARMSYLRFEDQADGVHVFFDDVTDPGPIRTVANFNETDIATLNWTSAHTIRFSINFKSGQGNDVVKIFIDGKKKATGTTWEDYYRYDPEQAAGNGNQVSPVSKLIFRESGTATPANSGNGFLVDNVTLTASARDHNDDNNNGDNDDNDDNDGQNDHHGH